MKQFCVFCLIVGLGLCFIAASGDRVQDVNLYPVTVKETLDNPASKMVKRDPDFGKIPLYFIPNQGQVDEKARLYAKTSRYMLWMTKQGLVFDSIRKVEATHPAPSGHPSQEGNKGLPHSPYLPYSTHSPKIERDVSRLIFRDANSNPGIVPFELTRHNVSYFKGRDPSKWQTGIQTSKAVLYKDLYNGIDLKVYGVEKQVEYDWIVKSGADPGKISFEYKDVKTATIDNEGNLVIETIFGKLMHKRPVSYQLIEGKKVLVESTFTKIGENNYGFKVEKYNRDYELIIDPMVCPIYSTYLGGSGSDIGWGIAVDSDGYTYVTGYTGSTDFPIENAYQETLAGNMDVFVTKLSPLDGCPVYSTYIGGSNSDKGLDIVVDSNGCAYVTGSTSSTDFPTTNAYQGTLKGVSDAFVAKLSSGGNSLVYSTYLGGYSSESGNGITVDSDGKTYVTGSTSSSNFPTANAYQQTFAGNWDAFVTKLTPGGNELEYSTYLGGSDMDNGNGITVDSHGSAYVTGLTSSSSNFPTKNPYQDTFGGGDEDAFVTKFSPTGKYLLYSTYLGGSRAEEGWRIELDRHENAYVAGDTSSEDFPTNNAFQETHGGSYDAFVTKLSTAGDDLVYSTFLGGTGYDNGYGIAVDHSGSAYITGLTRSSSFPVVNAYQETYAGGQDAFVTKLTPSGNALSYSTFLGGSSSEEGNDIAVDSSKNATVTGQTNSADFPTHNACQNSLVEGQDAFAARFCSCDSEPVLWVSKNLLNFAYKFWGGSTGPQSFLIRNLGGGTLNWIVSENSQFIECNPTSGTNFGDVEVSLNNPGALPKGASTAKIIISDSNAPNSPQTIFVTIMNYNRPDYPPEYHAPFGYFETPVNYSTVSGSVPLTGWALDDIEVEKVELCLGSCKDSQYIGRATFVEGARPDVAQVYPDYPYNTRAGWGYLMLTHLLPNGNHTIWAEAKDREGHWVTLGLKTITIDNANAVKPFGTIDSPTPGGTSSGGNYKVSGWALTPLPKTIPSDGIDVYVDGVMLGKATYGIYNADVYGLFPNYNNSGGAGFYYWLNTLDLDNGLHTIQCVVTDNDNETDGIGSRYFYIKNIGTINSLSQTSDRKYHLMTELADIPVDYWEPVRIKKGYGKEDDSQLIYPDEDGVINLEIKELERIMVRLNQSKPTRPGDREFRGTDRRFEQQKTAAPARDHQFQYTGYLVMEGRLWSLPIGSSLNTRRSIFYWQPGVAYFGEYQLVFVGKGLNGEMKKKLMNVNIVPKFSR
ncbi:MAG: SBBP repeat-containing protein [Candidatus Aminicenantes bacterium]|jgi:hypothetical protein